MATGFGGVHKYDVGGLIFMSKDTSKISFDVLLRAREWVYEKRRNEVFRSKIDLRLAPNIYFMIMTITFCNSLK